MLMHVLGAFAAFERSLIVERTKVGLKRAREAGRIGGGQFKMTAAQEAHALERINAGKSQTEVAKDQRVSKATISRLVWDTADAIPPRAFSMPGSGVIVRQTGKSGY